MKLAMYRNKYCVYSRDAEGKPVRRSLGTSDRQEAERRFAEFHELNRKRETSKGYLLSQLWDLRITALHGRRTASNMEWSGRAILPFFGHLRPDLITAPTTRQYMELRRSQGRKEGTILTELNHLRCCLSWAHKEGLIIHDLRMPAPSRPPAKIHFLTKPQASVFLSSCQFPHVRLFTILALTTGARASALLELTWDQVDLDRKLIELRAEEMANKKGRATVPINTTAYEALRTAKARTNGLYVIQWAGDRVRSIKKGIGAVARASGLPWVTPHVFRHSAAVWMAEAGTSMEEIAQFLGHSDINVTRRVYARFSPDYLRGAALALELTV